MSIKAMSTQVTIEFDGGTPCNIPRLGYGIGYGSYRVTLENTVVGQVSRISHEKPMSANSAEVWTLVRAIEKVDKLRQAVGGPFHLHIIGDSKIALNYVRENPKTGKGSTDELRQAVEALGKLLKNFTFTAQWKGRANSVALFGH